MTYIFSNMDDVIDSRDIVDRIAELEADSNADQEELATLKALVVTLEEETGQSVKYGLGLIRDSYFKEYAEEFARDIGAISNGFQWPLDHIDWEAAAEALQMDYVEIDFDGVTYWVR